MDVGKELYQLVRSRLVMRETSLNAWSKDCGYTRQFVEQALLGKAKGQAAESLVRHVCQAAGVALEGSDATPRRRKDDH